MAHDRVPTLPRFAAQHPYPGRGIALGRDPAGTGFVAYWVTGRSPESQCRRIIVGANSVEISDTESRRSDPLRHYTAIVRTDGRIVAGNGTHVLEVHQDIAQGTNPFEALCRLDSEPDPPIRTPRITATASLAADGVQGAVLSGAVSHPMSPGVPHHNMLHVRELEPGQCHAMTTYAADAETAVVATSGSPATVAITSPWPQLLGPIWDSLDPALRVAACVVPLADDLRTGCFTGLHPASTTEAIELADGRQ